MVLCPAHFEVCGFTGHKQGRGEMKDSLVRVEEEGAVVSHTLTYRHSNRQVHVDSCTYTHYTTMTYMY